MSRPRIAGFRLGVYIFKDAEIVDFAAPYGVFSVARRFDPELDAFLVAEAMRPVQTQAGFTVLPNYAFADRPAMDAFLIRAASALVRSSTTGACTNSSMACLTAACSRASAPAPGSTGGWACSTASRPR